MMKKYALFFYINQKLPNENTNDGLKLEYLNDWHHWISGLKESTCLENGNHFSTKAKVLHSDGSETLGPFLNQELSIAGFLIISCADIESASKYAQKCPILKGEGNRVEVREIA
jgi:hypothetical protein